MMSTAERGFALVIDVDQQVRTGRIAGAAAKREARRRPGNTVQGDGLTTPVERLILRSRPLTRSMDTVDDGDSAVAWQIYWVPNFTSNDAAIEAIAVYADLLRR